MRVDSPDSDDIQRDAVLDAGCEPVDTWADDLEFLAVEL